ncbi:MAG: hypothetical protein H6817_10970 [Phycisphaerales bacterium]|nr:hypothetical protein [Phycisphaerales bacterium]
MTAKETTRRRNQCTATAYAVAESLVERRGHITKVVAGLTHRAPVA